MKSSSDQALYSDILALPNGCLCCNIKSSSVMAIENLIERSDGNFDYILLEATGVADPGNIASMFWLDKGLGSRIALDGIITVIDAKHILSSLEEVHNQADVEPQQHGLTTAHLQISHADVMLLNKIDLVESGELRKITDRLKSINSMSPILQTSYCRINLDSLLDLKAFESVNWTEKATIDSSHAHLDPQLSTLAIHVPILDEIGRQNLDEW